MVKQDHVYRCTDRRCPQYLKLQYMAMAPSDVRLATGRPVHCQHCNDVLQYKGKREDQ